MNNDSTQQNYASSIAGAPKRTTNKWLYIFLGLLLLGGVGIFLFARSGGTPEPTPTPSFGVVPVDEFAEDQPGLHRGKIQAEKSCHVWI